MRIRRRNKAAGLPDNGRQRRPKHTMRRRLAAPLMAFAALATSPASALDSLGNAVAVIPNAVGVLGGEQVTIIQGSDLFEGQTISTGPSGEVQIVFVDDTRMVIGPNSALQIERYLLRDPNSFSQLAVNALGGTFRFISGNSPSDAYSMRTPGGTIGVRGTAFDATISWDGLLIDVMALHGTVFLCPADADSCTVLSERCSVGTITGVLHAEVIRNEQDRAEVAQAKFPFGRPDRSPAGVSGPQFPRVPRRAHRVCRGGRPASASTAATTTTAAATTSA